MNGGHLTLYTIYHNPSDYPGKYVMRPSTIGERGLLTLGDAVVSDTLEEARATVPPFLFNLGRMRGDDPVIAEVWV